MLFDDFVAGIDAYQMIGTGDSVVVAVSGGADSVCLLHLIYRLQKVLDFSLVCAHVNHGLRTSANKDASFVKDLCEKLHVPFVLHEEDVGKKAQKEKISVELAGREVRYAFFKSLKPDVILTAHNKNDVAESVLLHLIRGCGLEGLTGISPKREDGVCRPLLQFSRLQIEAYLKMHKLTWCEDESNADTQYVRNHIRHSIIPQMAKINPSVVDTIWNMTDILSAENRYLQSRLDDASALFSEGGLQKIKLDVFLKMPTALQRRLLRSFFDSYHDIQCVMQLANGKNGNRFLLKDGRIVEKEYDFLTIYKPMQEAIPTIKLPEKGSVIFGNYRITVGGAGMALPKREYVVRTRKNGDTFVPEGMTGKKKLKDFFIDEKIPRRLRDCMPMIVCGNEIAAVGTLRRSQNFVPKEEPCMLIHIQKINNV